MISSDVLRGHLETLVLKLVTEKDRYGYEIAKEIKSRTDGRFEMKEATLYSTVQRLERNKLITSYIGEKSHGGKRRYYRITTLGSAYLKEKEKEWHHLQDIMGIFMEDKS